MKRFGRLKGTATTRRDDLSQSAGSCSRSLGANGATVSGIAGSANRRDDETSASEGSLAQELRSDLDLPTADVGNRRTLHINIRFAAFTLLNDLNSALWDSQITVHTTEEQMAHVEIWGWGIDLSCVPVSAEEAKELTETGISEERYDKFRDEDLHLEGQGYVSDIEVLVDGEGVPLDEREEVTTEIVGKPGGHYLIVEEAWKGITTEFQIEGPFVPSKLTRHGIKLIMPDKDTRQISVFKYAGEEDENGGRAEGKSDVQYVIYPDGSSRDVKLL